MLTLGVSIKDENYDATNNIMRPNSEKVQNIFNKIILVHLFKEVFERVLERTSELQAKKQHVKPVPPTPCAMRNGGEQSNLP